MRMPVILLGLAAFGAPPAMADDVTSSTVIGPNAAITQGVEAMLDQHWLQGIELTERGLASLVSPSERAAAYSNLCAAYVALHDFDRALTECDQALKLDTGNWRTYNNRAGALLGKGRLDEALHAVEAGLALDPVAGTLRRTETIVRDQLRRLYLPQQQQSPTSG